MSDYLGNPYEQRRERLEERRGARHDRRGYQDDYDDHGNHGSHHRGQRPYDDDDGPRRPQGQGRDYGPPSGPPPSAFGSLGGLDRGDFASDEDIARMVSTGEFDERHEPRRQGQGRGYGSPQSGHGRPQGGERRDAYDRYDAPTGSPPGQGQGYGQRANEHGRYDAPAAPPPGQGYKDRANEYGRYDTPSGPPPGQYGDRANEHGRYDTPSGPPSSQGYGDRASEHGRYDAPSGAPPGRGYQSQQSYQQGYGSGGTNTPDYGGGRDRPNQYEPPQTQGRTQYESPQGPPSGQGRGQGNAPAGGFMTSRDGEDKYGGPTNDRSEPSRRGEAASYYQQDAPGQGDRYARLAGIAQEHGEDPELYRRATQGLQEKIQAQAQSRPQRRGDEDDGYKAHADAHRKAYEEDDDGPMDADTIGAAAAMEAFKQTTTGSSKAPAGGFQASKSGGPSSKQGRDSEEEEGETASRAGASGGLQDKMMALAMSQAGKLFDKKNAGSSGDKSQDKAQAMQSAAATAMQLFGQYQTKGKLDSGDMSKVMGLAKLLL